MKSKSSEGVRSKAVLVRVEIGSYSGVKRDRELSQAVADTHDASSEAINVAKNLVSSYNYLKEIKKIVGKVRNYVSDRTLPWSDGTEGWRLISTEVRGTDSTYRRWQKDIADFENEFNKEVEAFLKNYDNLITADKDILGEAFDISDYKSVEELRDKFKFESKVQPIPNSSDLRVGLSRSEEDKLRNKLSKEIEGNFESARTVLLTRVVEKLSTVSESLNKYDPENKGKGFFNDSLVPNLRDLATTVGDLNVNSDPEIEKLRQKISSDLTLDDTQTLREDSSKRKKVAKSAKDVASSAADLLARTNKKS